MNNPNEEGFAGLPPTTQMSGVMVPPVSPQPQQTAQERAAGIPAAPSEDYQEFTIPEKLMGMRWNRTGRPDSDRTFGMTELTTAKKLRAGKLAGAKMDFQAVVLEQQMMCIYKIGEHYTRNNRTMIQNWLNDIGAKGMDIVERCYSEMTSATETESQEVLSQGNWKSG